MPKIAAVIGSPISHSLSPILHNFLLDQYSISGKYIPILVKKETFEKQIDELLQNPDISGFNATIPYKEDIYHLFKSRNYNISEESNIVKAINTIYKKNGEIFGANSDIFGFEENLRQNSSNLSYDNTLLLGAGGAASAALYSMINLGFKNIYIYNRTKEKAEKLIYNQSLPSISQSLSNPQNIRVVDEVNAEILQDLDLIVNCTPIGMKNDLKHSFSLESVKNSNCHVYDLIYNPLYTDLLKQAQQLKLPIVTGIGMLIYQAFLGFEQWFGIKPQLSQNQFDNLTNVLISEL
jgi:shikimate dehydrogenase